jgi:hypothetical protein
LEEEQMTDNMASSSDDGGLDESRKEEKISATNERLNVNAVSSSKVHNDSLNCSMDCVWLCGFVSAI